jgi:hypothetical protein
VVRVVQVGGQRVKAYIKQAASNDNVKAIVGDVDAFTDDLLPNYEDIVHRVFWAYTTCVISRFMQVPKLHIASHPT